MYLFLVEHHDDAKETLLHDDAIARTVATKLNTFNECRGVVVVVIALLKLVA